MQVSNNTQIAESVTIGARPAKAVTMVQDAAFFQMMSSNLYSNEKLAVVREILCNAWDAHIESGNTGTPIEVTFTKDNDFIVADYGNGIDESVIDAIYGTYGKSSKCDDDTTTGGFGLGSKSPWALVETFQVTSDHNGTRTVYSMERSSTEQNGMPVIIPVVSVPTDRTGLTVSLRMDSEIVEEMRVYVRAIAMHGDMRVEFHDQKFNHREQLSRLCLDPEPGSYKLSFSWDTSWYFDYMPDESIYVRYGAVLYPMLKTPNTREVVNLLKSFMRTIGATRLLVQAAPGTLALTPSRESLSGQKMTEDGLTDLCVNLVNKIEEDFKARLPEALDDLEEFLLNNKNITSQSFSHSAPIWQNIKQADLQRYVESRLCKDFRKKEEPRMRSAEMRGFLKHHKFADKQANRFFKKYRKLYHCDPRFTLHDAVEHFYKKTILKKMGKALAKSSGKISYKNLSVFSLKSDFVYYPAKPVKKSLIDGIAIDRFNILKCFVDSPIVVLSTRITNINESLEDCPEILNNSGVAWIYKLPASDRKNHTAIKKHFEDCGYAVVDLLENHPWDSVALERLMIQRERAAAAKEQRTSPKAASSVVLSNSMVTLESAVTLCEGRGRVIYAKDPKGSEQDSIVISDKGEYYVESSTIYYNGSLGHFVNFLDMSSDEISKGVVVYNGIGKNKAIKRGLVSVDEYFVNQFLKRICDPKFIKYRTKERLAGLNSLGTDDRYITMLKKVGIRVKGINSLYENPEYERLLGLAASTSIYGVSKILGKDLSEKQVNCLNGVKPPVLDLGHPVIEVCQILDEDPVVSNLGYAYGLLTLINDKPEYIPGIKSLLLCALKRK